MKYLLLNDINYIIKKKKKILITFLLMSLIICIIYKNENMNFKDIINIATSINYTYSNSLYIELIMYIFKMTLCIYLILDNYIKDIKYQLSNIFLRISPQKWIYSKSIIFSIIMIILKLIEYTSIIILLIILKYKIDLRYIVKSIIIDYIYMIFIGYFSLSIYIIFNLIKRFRLIIMIPISILVVMFPKNILSTYPYSYVLILLVIFIIIIISLIFKNNSQKIIQKLGGI